jgi:hypothetical protein
MIISNPPLFPGKSDPSIKTDIKLASGYFFDSFPLQK